MGCQFLLQGLFSTQGSNLDLLYLPALAGRVFTTRTTWEAHCYHCSLWNLNSWASLWSPGLFSMISCSQHAHSVLPPCPSALRVWSWISNMSTTWELLDMQELRLYPTLREGTSNLQFIRASRRSWYNLKCENHCSSFTSSSPVCVLGISLPLHTLFSLAFRSLLSPHSSFKSHLKNHSHLCILFPNQPSPPLPTMTASLPCASLETGDNFYHSSAMLCCSSWWMCLHH